MRQTQSDLDLANMEVLSASNRGACASFGDCRAPRLFQRSLLDPFLASTASSRSTTLGHPGRRGSRAVAKRLVYEVARRPRRAHGRRRVRISSPTPKPQRSINGRPDHRGSHNRTYDHTEIRIGRVAWPASPIDARPSKISSSRPTCAVSGKDAPLFARATSRPSAV